MTATEASNALNRAEMSQTDQNQETQKPESTAALISGTEMFDQMAKTDGQGESSEQVPPQEEISAQPPAAALKPKVIFEGLTGQKFSEVSQLTDYVQELERRQIELEGKLSGYREAKPGETSVPAAHSDESDFWVDAEQKLFSNPVETLKQYGGIVKGQVLSEIQQRDQLAKSEERLWNEFYSENEDLKGLNIIVQTALNQNYEKLKSLPPSHAKRVLAEESRAIIGLVREKGGTAEVLSNAPVETLGATRGGAGQRMVVPPQVEAPKNFVEQLKAFRSGKGKVL